ncbi:MAG: cyclic lactone autoinducer peptide [Clostridiales bacterium]|nr:cyclic lactone autoinducer peptide [Clostridiales bacterium]
MKNLKSALLKWSGVFASLVLIVGTASAQSMCWFWYHQPEVPKGMDKFTK